MALEEKTIHPEDYEETIPSTPRKGVVTNIVSPFIGSPSKRGIIPISPSKRGIITGNDYSLSPVRTPNGRAGRLSPQKRTAIELNHSARKRANNSVYSRLMDDENDENDYLNNQDIYISEAILLSKTAYGNHVEMEEDISERPRRVRRAVKQVKLSSDEEPEDFSDDEVKLSDPSDSEDLEDIEELVSEEELQKVSEDEDPNVSFTGSPKKRRLKSQPKPSPKKLSKKEPKEQTGRRRVGRPSKSEDVIGKVKSIFHEDDEMFFKENKSPLKLQTKVVPQDTSEFNKLLDEFADLVRPVITGVSKSTLLEEVPIPTEFVPLPIPKLDKDGKIIDQEFLQTYFKGVNIENNLRGRFLDEKAFFLEGSEGYFEQHSARPKPSSNSLTQLAPQIEQEEFAPYIELGNKVSQEEKKKLCDLHKLLYHQWCFELSQGFNLNFYGIGSKLNLLNEFVLGYFVDWFERTYPQDRLPNIMVVNGFNPNIKLKKILEDIMKSFLTTEEVYEDEDSDEDTKIPTGKKKKIRFPKHVSESVPFIMNHVESERSEKKNAFILPRLILLFHNIDGETFRDEKIQNSFSQLSSLPELWLISSTDNINAPLLWDLFKLKNFNFLWHDLTTYDSYAVELSFKDVLNMGKSKKFIGNKGAKYVLSSLTSNARNLYRILLQKQLAIMKKASLTKSSRVGLKGTIKFGLEFKDFYGMCLEEFITSNEITFRTVLGEFIEHKMSVLSKDETGVEMIYIPFNYDEMEKLLDDEFI